MPPTDSFDVVVVGGGPAGAAMAWSLARRGVRVAVVERAKFPREKVCGDFVEPAGLRILDAMHCQTALEASAPLPITHSRVFVQSRVAYRGEIPFYEAKHGLPPHGYIVPRVELDAHLIERANAASATVYEGCAATGVTPERRSLRVELARGKRRQQLRARLVVGADGTRSTVARSFGLSRNDRRYIAISQRGYVEGVSVERGEASIWFDEELFPGYGWMFPMTDGRANVGVGVSSEACHRHGLSIPALFDAFIEKLRRRHPGCARIRFVGRPLGGAVHTYGGILRNHFDGGLLVGDAGAFVDPMTGEGITPGMESALIGSATIAAALERGRFDAAFLSRFERDFRRHFDPSMRFLDLAATVMRNRHLGEFWLRAATRGFEEAAADPSYARVAGCWFGGLDLRPLSLLGQIWLRVLGYVAEGNAQMWLDLVSGRSAPAGWLLDLDAWQRGLRRSLFEDPRWHVAWTRDVVRKAGALTSASLRPGNPRVRGLALEAAP